MKSLYRVYFKITFLLLSFVLCLSAWVLADPVSSETIQEIEQLKDKVQELTHSIEDVRQDYAVIQVYSKKFERDMNEHKGLPIETPFTKSMEKRSEDLATHFGRIKIRGEITAIALASANQRPNDSVQGGQAVINHPPVQPDHFGQTNHDDITGSGSFDLYLEAKITDNTTFFTDLEANSDNPIVFPSYSLPNGNVTFPTHLSAQNLDVLNILEIYIESEWYDKKLITTIGKIDLSNYFDGNNVAWDEHSQFLSFAFVNNPAFYSVAPFDSIGARALWDMGWGFTTQIAAVKQVDSGDKLFNEYFGMLEVDYKTNAILGREGNYRIYGYVKEIPALNPQQIPTGKNQNAIGAGLSMDQMLTDKLSVFSRLGWNEKKLADSVSTLIPPFSAVASSVTFGGQYQGLLANRPDDVFGAAYGIINPADPFGTVPEEDFNELFMEYYYSYTVRENFHLSPLLQVMKHPAGDDDENYIVIFGGRAFLEF